MKVAVFGKEIESILDIVNKYGFEIVEKNPDFVISFGGDGTVMRSETEYPSIPKIILKNSKVCKLCSDLSNEEVLKKIVSNSYKIEEYWKLSVRANAKTISAINDVIIHNADPRHAIRYKFSVNGNQIGHEVIGDGIVVSTPLGSTGYYRSITDSFFELGIGLAFNNSTEQSDHMVLKEDSQIDIEITRGPAMIYADNQNEVIKLNVGDMVHIKKSDKFAKIVKVV